MHHPQGMLEACMHGSWVHLICPGELANAPQPLERLLGYYRHLPVVGLYEAVHWTSNLVCLVGVQVSKQFSPILF